MAEIVNMNSYRVLVEYMVAQSRYIRLTEGNGYEHLINAIVSKFKLDPSIDIEVTMLSGFGDNARTAGIGDDDDMNELMIEIKNGNLDKLLVFVGGRLHEQEQDEIDLDENEIEDQVIEVIRNDPQYYKNKARRMRVFDDNNRRDGGAQSRGDYVPRMRDYNNKNIGASRSVPALNRNEDIKDRNEDLRGDRSGSAPAPQHQVIRSNMVRARVGNDDMELNRNRDRSSEQVSGRGGLGRGLEQRAPGRGRRFRERNYNQSARMNDYNDQRRDHYQERNYLLGSNDRSRSYGGSSRGLSDTLFKKKALNAKFTFSGISYHSFKKSIKYHINIHELSAKDEYMMLMGGDVIDKEPFIYLQLNIDAINPYFYNPDALLLALDDGAFSYIKAVNVIWKLLDDNYGDKDRVHSLQEELKKCEQGDDETVLAFITRFNTILHELRLEIKHQNMSKNIYLEMTGYEYGVILQRNLEAKIQDYVVKAAIVLYPDCENYTYSQIMMILNQCIKIERVKRRSKKRKKSGSSSSSKPVKIFSIENDNKYTDFNNNTDSLTRGGPNNYNQLANKSKYCWNGKKSRCRKDNCVHTHFPENTAASVIIKYFKHLKSKECRRGVTCRGIYCRFGHPPDRRRKIGDCRSDGNCKRIDCIYYHNKQKDRNVVDEAFKNTKSGIAAVETMDREHLNDDKNLENENNNRFIIRNVNVGNDKNFKKKYEDDEVVEYIMNNPSKTTDKIENDVISNGDYVKLPKVTKAYRVWGDNEYKIVPFIDSGADSSIAGMEPFEKFPEYIVRGTNKSVVLIPAGGKGAYKSTLRVRIPFIKEEFSIKHGKIIRKKKLFDIWYMKGLDYKTLILGRDGMKELGLFVSDASIIKQTIYTKLREHGINELPNDEEANALIRGLQIGNDGNQGIYKLNSAQNTAEKVDIDKLREVNVINGSVIGSEINLIDLKDNNNEKALDLNIKEENNNKIGVYLNDVNNHYDIKKKVNLIYSDHFGDIINYYQHNKRFLHHQEIGKRLFSDSKDYDFKQIFKIDKLSDIYKKIQDEPLSIDPNIINNEMLRLIRNNNRLIKDPSMILEAITYGTKLSDDQIKMIKQRLVGSLLVSSFADGPKKENWSQLSIINAPPFELKITDDSLCKKSEPFTLRHSSDNVILDEEMETIIESKSMHYVRQNEILLHISPAFVVYRNLGLLPDGTQLVKSRVAIDFTDLNDITHPYEARYDKTVEEVQLHLAGNIVFNQTDIIKYFYNLSLAEDSKKYAGVTWYDKNGKKKVAVADVVMHGMTDAPIVGQEITSKAYADTDCSTYQDDIFGGGTTIDEGIENFMRMLKIANDNNFILDPSATFCCCDKIECIGFIVNKNGIYPLPRNTTKAFIFDLKQIGNYSLVRRWCGAITFLISYLPNIQIDLKRIKTLLFPKNRIASINKSGFSEKKKVKLKDQLIANVDDEEVLQIISGINNKIKNVPLIHYVDRRRNAGHIIQKTDSSLYGSGSTWWQKRGKLYVLIGIYSVGFDDGITNWSATERELLGILKGVQKKQKILDRPFFLFTDHKPLIHLFGLDRKRTKNYKLMRMRLALKNYKFSITHLPGNSLDIAVEDWLSRSIEDKLDENVKSDGITFSIDDNGEIINPYKKNINYMERSEEDTISDDFRKYIINMFDLELIDLEGFNADIIDDVIMKPMDDKYDIMEMNINLIEIMNNASYDSLYKNKNYELDDFDKLQEKSCLMEINTMNYFAECCDIQNIPKNIILNDINLNKNLVDYRKKNEIDGVFNLDELRDIHILQSMVMNLRNKYDANTIIVSSPDLHNEPLVIDENDEKKDILLFDVKKEKLVDPDRKKLGLRDYKEIYNEIEKKMVNPMETRSMKRLREDKEYQKRLELMNFHSVREHIFDDSEGDILCNKANPIRTIYETQKVEFGHLLNYFRMNDEKELERVNIFEIDYVDLIKKKLLAIGTEGLLIYEDNKYIIPTKIRIYLMRYYHTTPALHHRGQKVMIEEFKKRFFWIGMTEDIKIYISQCGCKAAKLGRKRNAGFKDIGIQSVYYATGPNQYCYMDLYGALKTPESDSNYAAVIVDGFDALAVGDLLLPVYDITALGITEFIIFEWIWKLGIMDVLISDNGSVFKNKMNKLFCMIFGLKKGGIIVYSPWGNAFAEIKMKGINQGIMIESSRREMIGYDLRGIIDKAISGKNMRTLIRSSILVNNNTVKKGTGYYPNEMRMIHSGNIMMDVLLKLDCVKTINSEDYVIDGIVDYDRFMDALNIHRDFIMKEAKLGKLNYLNDKKLKSDEASLKSQIIGLDDYVIYKGPWKSKKLNNNSLGWIVNDVLRKGDGDKQYYKIRNIFSGEIIDANQGHLRLFHQPLVSADSMFRNETTNIIDLENDMFKDIVSNKRK